MNAPELRLSYQRVGRNGVAKVVAMFDGEDSPAHVDEINLAKARDRDRFADGVIVARPGVKDRRRHIGETLLRFAGELTADSAAPATDVADAEIDVSAVVRPERFIRSEVSGLAVPTTTQIDGKPVGRYMLYLRWADGRREARPLTNAIDLPNGERLFIHPQPGEPLPTVAAGWSRPARRAWLAGESPPTPAAVFQRIAAKIAHYIDLPRDQAAGTTATLALWSMLSYCFGAWDAVPYLFVGGALGTGKSRVFDVLARLVFRPLPSSNVTAPALFRSLHMLGGTTLLDEAERLKDTRSPDVAELLSMLLAGYKRGGQATRLEPIGDSFRPVAFDVYGPKALACIAGLPPALASRAIEVTMFRAAPASDKPRRRVDDDAGEWQSIRDDLHALALEHGATFLAMPDRRDICPAMAGRSYELWQPLLAVAEWVEADDMDGLLAIVRDHAMQTIDRGQDDQTPDVDELLLRTLANELRGGAAPTPKDVLESVERAEQTTFAKWTARTLSNRLTRYGLRTSRSHGRRVYQRDCIDHLQMVQKNYGIDLGFADGTNPE